MFLDLGSAILRCALGTVEENSPRRAARRERHPEHLVVLRREKMLRKWEKEGAAPQQIGNAGQGSSAGAYTCPLGTAFLMHATVTL